MRRERREIIHKMWEVERQADIDRQLAHGYTPSDFGAVDLFEEVHQALYEALAATYGMTAEEYQEHEYEVSEMLLKKGVCCW